MSKVNQTRFLVQYELWEYKFRSNESVCNAKQKWYHDKCRCECKKMVDWRSCEKSYMWNPSKCGCGRDKTCGLALQKKWSFPLRIFFSKCDQIRSLLKKSLTENFIFCAVWWVFSYLITGIWFLDNCEHRKRVIDNILFSFSKSWVCEDKILNTTETKSIVDKKLMDENIGICIDD